MNLSARGYQVSSSATGGGALDLVATLRPDLLILDLGLPDMDGLEVIRRLRARAQSLAILILSARSGSQEKVAALDLGANDYITKPFDMNELLARLRAALRRTRPADAPSVISLGIATIDLAARRATRTNRDGSVDETSIHLTPTEWRMLETLLRRPGMLTSPAELLVTMRGEPEPIDRSYLRIYVQQLRRKLEIDPSRPRHLLTEPGLGYRYMP
jgi:two-component system KDP operon response regulator KdpE